MVKKSKKTNKIDYSHLLSLRTEIKSALKKSRTNMVRAALIKFFELAFEQSWKILKKIQDEKFGSYRNRHRRCGDFFPAYLFRAVYCRESRNCPDALYRVGSGTRHYRRHCILSNVKRRRYRLPEIQRRNYFRGAYLFLEYRDYRIGCPWRISLWPYRATAANNSLGRIHGSRMAFNAVH